jgi:hypothetical protein
MSDGLMDGEFHKPEQLASVMLLVAMLERLDGKLDRIADDMKDVKGRLAAVESMLVALATECSALVGASVRMQHAIDHLAHRLEMLENAWFQQSEA